jgi:RNA 2',3'-cyclic 3'-phosphodiesterase
VAGEARRLFVGLPVSLETVDALAGAAESLARRAQERRIRVRWLAPATYHVTVKFLGACRPEGIDALADALARAAAGIAPLRFATARLGAFPSPARATVVWAGVEDPGGRLAALAERVEAELAGLGVPREARRFHPHVTIARLREPADVSQVLLPLAEQPFSETSVPDLILYESQMKSSGSEYSPLRRVPLGAARRQSGRLQRPATGDTTTGGDQ